MNDIKIVLGPRGSGRTTQLIEQAGTHGYYIVVHNQQEASRVAHYAQEQLGINIPFPLTYREFLEKKYYSKGCKGFLIDNIDMFLQELSPQVPIIGFSATIPSQEFNKVKRVSEMNSNIQLPRGTFTKAPGPVKGMIKPKNGMVHEYDGKDWVDTGISTETVELWMKQYGYFVLEDYRKFEQGSEEAAKDDFDSQYYNDDRDL